MKKRLFILLSCGICLTASACSEHNKSAAHITTIAASPATETKTMNTLDSAQITNPTAKAAFEAWQNNDSKAWLALFTAKPELLDDGNPRDFQEFSKMMGKERFTSIDRVENNGTGIVGGFDTPWGAFKTYFRFTVGVDGKISRLEIGQAK